ncbi:uncharacterized protein BDW70DRAFT_145983 [Aspergillus foveolatus]|uniref:uncharacterized protein n=1 Tax=Aspergillus foveolatus TaxID=210207 RepID=UPI003CCD955F
MASAFWQQIRGNSALERIPLVKVALICDGVDVAIPELRDMAVNGTMLGEDSWHISPWYISASGHGTAQARVIHKLCPHIHLHVAKVATCAEGTRFQEDYLTRVSLPPIIISWNVPVTDEFGRQSSGQQSVMLTSSALGQES